MSASPRRTGPGPRFRILAALLALALAGGCARPGGQRPEGYLVSASFERAAGLFELSRVQAMGLDVGHVEDIAVADDHIEVTLRIDPDVPLPEDVQATIAPLTVIGERHVVLAPAFEPGASRLPEGGHIPLVRTRSAPEPDDVLDAVLDVAGMLDTPETRQLLSGAADTLDGRGEAMGRALDAGARIAQQLREQDQDLLAAAEGLADLASVVNRRGDQLTALVEGYADGLDLLAADRDRLRPLLAEVLRVVDEGEQLVTAVGTGLPEDLAKLTTIALQLEANTASIATMLEQLPAVVDVLVAAYRPETQAIKLRFTVGPTLNSLLGQIAGLLGLPGLDCLPTPDLDCPGGAP